MSKPIHIGISTCPNDTFAFHGLIERRVNLRGLEFRFEMLDVEELNQRLFAGDFDVAKASFHAAIYLSSEFGVLPSGSALGFGVGPLLLAARPNSHPRDLIMSKDRTSRKARVLCPGEHTTATLLYRLFHRDEGNLEHVVFSEIMPQLVAAKADFGVCIHEGRFTWEQQGLALVEDLGEVWEKATSAPLPLGGILARHMLGTETISNIQDALRDSIEYGLSHREETIPTMRRYAQELTTDVMFSHVDLYVNDFTLNLGDKGRSALDQLCKQAQHAGILTEAIPQLTVSTM